MAPLILHDGLILHANFGCRVARAVYGLGVVSGGACGVLEIGGTARRAGSGRGVRAGLGWARVWAGARGVGLEGAVVADGHAGAAAWRGGAA
jgi:hypothetical protein